MSMGDAFGSWDHSLPIIGYTKKGRPVYPIMGGDGTTDNRTAVAEAAEQSGLSNDEVNQIVDQVTARFAPLANASNNPEAIAALQGAEFLTSTSGTIKAESADLGTEFVNSEMYKEIQTAKGSRFTRHAELAATLTSQPTIQPDVQVGFQLIRFKRLTIADLVTPGTTTGGTVRYLYETTATNGAAAIAEGSPKPASTLAADVVDEPVRKIATTIKITDEMLEDFEQTRSWVNGRLALFVQQVEEAELYAGSGTAPHIKGLINRTNVQSQAVGSETYFKDFIAVQKAKKKVRDYFYNPDALVVAPGDWLEMQLEADANGQFGGGGPFRGPYGNGTGPQEEGPYAGLRVVVTPAATEGTALVGAYREAAQIFRRSGVTVEMTNSNEDDFLNNLVAVRAEERLALAVYSGYAFVKVTGIS